MKSSLGCNSMLIRVAEQLVTHGSVECMLEVGDIRCTCNVGRQRVPQWNSTNREPALSQICRNDGGNTLLRCPMVLLPDTHATLDIWDNAFRPFTLGVYLPGFKMFCKLGVFHVNI